jgi:hypothetical protein
MKMFLFGALFASSIFFAVHAQQSTRNRSDDRWDHENRRTERPR